MPLPFYDIVGRAHHLRKFSSHPWFVSSLCHLNKYNRNNNDNRNNNKLCPFASSKMDATASTELTTEMEEDSMESSESDVEEKEAVGEIEELKRYVSY